MGKEKNANITDKTLVLQMMKVLNVREHSLTSPLMWLGHDLKSRLNVWTKVRKCPGVLVSAHQILMRNRCFLRKSKGMKLSTALGFSGPIFLDSGGFHFQKTGGTLITPNEVMEVQASLQPDVAAVLDIPLHPKASAKENNRRWQQTLQNTSVMIRQKTSTRMAIVLHAYDTGLIDERCEELRSIIASPAIVCIGSLVPLLRGISPVNKFSMTIDNESKTLQLWKYIELLLRRVRKYFPRSLIHIFGAGTFSTILLFYLLGADSVDSVAWRIKAAYGAICLPGLADRYVTEFKHSRTRRRLSRECLRILELCQCSVCDCRKLNDRLDLLASSFEARAVHNAQVFIDDHDSFRNELLKETYCENTVKRLRKHRRFAVVVNRFIENAM